MENSVSFSQQVIDAVDVKSSWYNETIMPQLHENYRLLHTCAKNLFDILVQKSLVKPDPYKLDRKISEIKSPDNSQFIDTERAVIIGARFSEYESMLDYICTYYKFSIDHFSIAEIKKLVDFNNSFLWSQFSSNSTKPNTRGLAALVDDARRGSNQLTVSSLSDIISKCSKGTQDINAELKELMEYQKEVYKCSIRKDIFQHPKFDKEKAAESPQAENDQIRKMYAQVMGKTPFYTALVEEIIKEDHAPNKAELQQAVLQKLQVQKKNTQKKTKTVDTRDMLMSAVLCFSGLNVQLEQVYTKLKENYTILQNEHNSLWDKLKLAIRQALGLPEKPVIYQLVITDKATNAKRKESLDFHAFTGEILKKVNFYASFAVKNSPGYIKIANAPEDKVLDFLNKQYKDMQRTMLLLIALNEYLKQAPQTADNRAKIKGLTMEFTTIKNIMVNTNQRRAEYISYVEEQEQMRKLGINEEDA